MSDHGKLELTLDEEKHFGFLCLAVTTEKDANNRVQNYAVTARVADNNRHDQWKCGVVIGKSCANCGDCKLKEVHQVVLTNDLPRVLLSSDSMGCRCYANSYDDYDGYYGYDGYYDYKPKFVLFISLHDETLPEPEPESKKYRFTDQDEAQKMTRFISEMDANELNANCKVRFADSEEPVFINRELLSVYSKTFRTMFQDEWKEKNAEGIKLSVNREDFLPFLQCLYLPPAPITMDNFKAVAMTADQYECPYLLDQCKRFAEDEAETVSTAEECKDFIEVAERLYWSDIMTTVIDSMKREGAHWFKELLKSEWMMPRKKSTVHALFVGIESIVSSRHMGAAALRANNSGVESTTIRFTDEAEAKKLHATCKAHFEDSEEPVFISRELLVVYCNAFRAMTDDDFKENKIKLEVKREDFLSFLDCLYYPPVPVTEYNFKAVLMVAKLYECPQLFEKCKEFAGNEASKATTVEDCKDYIEVAEHLGWDDLSVIKSMKSKGVKIFMKLLDSDWIEERSHNTQQALFDGLKEVVSRYL